ncbi:helix-turn-helix domain-containing protein [Pseudomonadota bacterium AL_CKDN230030165-1A_HGKHYDSX7]
MKKKKISRLAAELVEMADAQSRLGLMDSATHEKITARHLATTNLPTAEPMSAAQIREVRERVNLSQAALARYLNMTTGYVSQLERGATQARGPALALLNVIRRKGLDALS